MTTIDFITELFCRVDDKVDENTHSQAKLCPSELHLLCSMLLKEAFNVKKRSSVQS
jgi:hypothetical protein